MPGRDLVQLREHRLLDLHPLRHGLDDEVHVAEALVIGGPGDAPEDLVALRVGVLLGDLLLLHQVAELRLGHLPGLLEAGVDELLLDVLEDDRNARGGDHLGDLATHRAGAHDGGFEDEHGGGPYPNAQPQPRARGRSATILLRGPYGYPGQDRRAQTRTNRAAPARGGHPRRNSSVRACRRARSGARGSAAACFESTEACTELGTGRPASRPPIWPRSLPPARAPVLSGLAAAHLHGLVKGRLRRRR